MAIETLSPGVIPARAKSKRAILYTRVSTADQHPETQLLDLRQMAKDRGYEIVCEYDARDVVIFEDFGNGQTKLTMIGNETMEDARNSGQLEGWNQILEKVAAVIAGLAKAK